MNEKISPELKKILEERLPRCSERQKEVIVVRFGLEDGIVKTHEEAAAILGISTARVRQIENLVIRSHPGARRAKSIKDYYT